MDNGLSIKLYDAIRHGVVIADENHYKFSSNLTRNLALFGFEY